MREEDIIYDRTGKSVLRVCGTLVYDFQGKPRGFVVGKTVYDLHGQHRGFYIDKLVRDRMGKILGFAEGARPNGLELPFAEIPPVAYKNLPAPPLPPDATDKECMARPSVWSVMRLENMLV